MSIKRIREAIGTNIYSDGGCKQGQLIDREGTDGIATSSWNGISDRSGSIEHMSIKRIREAIGTNIYSDGGCKQWQLLDRDGSDGIATSTWNGISDRSGGIEDMSVKCIREGVGTNIYSDGGCKQRQ